MSLNSHAYDDGSGRVHSVPLPALRNTITELSAKVGMAPARADTFADVYMRATLRGLGHHDIHSLGDRLAALRGGQLNPGPRFRLQAAREALESYDGDNGPGELCSAFATERASRLADRHGIGLCTISASNHFLAAAPYVEKAAEEGYLAIVLSNAKPIMGVPGSGARIMGNSPFGFGTATNGEHPLLMDACLAYASFGTLGAMRAEGRNVPPTWGADALGTPTTDPGVIIDTGTSYPIGEHKGFGLALLMETLTGVLSGGQLLGETNQRYPGGQGLHSQTAIVIKPEGLMPLPQYRERVGTLVAGVVAKAPQARIPGRSSHANRLRAERDGAVVLLGGLVDELNRWAKALGATPLTEGQQNPGGGNDPRQLHMSART
jgi:LDH2 family malate/lactate/ureidoglycolate dehydrogenase